MASANTVKQVLRRVARVVTAKQQREGGGFVVRRPLGGREVSVLDPFLMLDHLGPVEYGPGEAVGAPDHPHRGFETVTYVLDGGFHHQDSKGNEGNLNSGWVQWMTAGSGVVHSEMPTAELLEKGGRMEGFQLWVNLPAKDKMIAPRYQDTPPSKIPKVPTPDGLGEISIIAGEALGTPATIETRTPMLYFDVRLQPSGAFDVPVPSNFNGFGYVYRGRGTFGENNTAAAEGQMTVFQSDNKTTAEPSIFPIRAPADSECRVLVIAGRPLNEPVARYGPFVMNTEEQIRQAFADYQSGRFGNIEGEEERRQKTDGAVRRQKETGSWEAGTKKGKEEL